MAERPGFQPGSRLSAATRFPSVLFQPLRHLSIVVNSRRLTSISTAVPDEETAERERFELSRAFRPYRFSGPALSTAQPPLRDMRTQRDAEEVGFEPTVRLRGQRFSRPPHSTALPPLRGNNDRGSSRLRDPLQRRLMRNGDANTLIIRTTLFPRRYCHGRADTCLPGRVAVAAQASAMRSEVSLVAIPVAVR